MLRCTSFLSGRSTPRIALPQAWREGSEQFAGTLCPAAASDRIYKIEGKCCSRPQAVCGHAYEEGAGGGTGRDPRETPTGPRSKRHDASWPDPGRKGGIPENLKKMENVGIELLRAEALAGLRFSKLAWQSRHQEKTESKACQGQKGL